MPLTGAGAQGAQLLELKQPVWTVFPEQTPPQRCWPAGQPIPEPVDALVDAAVLLAALVLVALLVVVDDVVVVPLVVVVVVGPLVVGSPPAPLVEGPGPSATLPPTPPPPKPPSPSLLPPVSAAFAQPWTTLPTASATNNKPKPIVFTPASTRG